MSTTDLDVVKALYSTLLTSPADATEEKLFAVFAKDAVSIPRPPMGSGAEGILKTLK